MRTLMFRLCVLIAALSALLAVPAAEAAATPPVPPAPRMPAFPRWQDIAVHSCADPGGSGLARCGAVRRTDVRPHNRANGSPYGFDGYYGPADLWSAYNLPFSPSNFSTRPAWKYNGQTVAIVDAYDDPRAESDLATYRQQFNLPACTHTNGCFLKVNQRGQQGSYPRGNTGWSEEISLDVDMVSAICPYCRILLVEANSASFSALGAAVNKAATLSGSYNGFTWTHANAISNSYGASEFSGETLYDAYYDHPGIAVTVSSGDNGYGVEYPAASPYVTAVGGTTLVKDSSAARGWDETAWSGAGSGCSAYEPQPTWQNAVNNPAVCPSEPSSGRSVADVAAVADPNTGVLVYDTFGLSGWYVFGGTSVASPIIASVYALAGNTQQIDDGSYPYANTGSLYDIVSGSNGTCGNYLCNAGLGSSYDGPTGNGTPDGTGGF